MKQALKCRRAYALRGAMKRSLLIAAAPALLLAACGRQESVDDLPSTEELAAAANAAMAKSKPREPETAENRDYVNDRHGFSITLPVGWTQDASAATADGVVFQDPGAGADIRVFWSANDDDKDLQQVVEAMNADSEGTEGRFIGDNEYRSTAGDGEGNRVAVRMLRKPDGSLVTATFVYPEMLNAQYAVLGAQTLDSLKLFDAPASAAPPPAANAAD